MAYRNPTGNRGEFTRDIRKEAGRYLREARLAAGLTQAKLAELAGIKFHTAISQLESGSGFVPPDRYVEFANALGIPLEEFTREQLRFAHPWAHAILFGERDELRRLRSQVPERRMNGGAR